MLNNKVLGTNFETFECAKRNMEYHYLLFSMLALENACLRVNVGVMDDYGQCPMVISILHLIIISF